MANHPLTELERISLRADLQRFVALIGEDRWERHATHLRNELQASPYRAKIAGDYHWLELELIAERGEAARATSSTRSADALAALEFASAVVQAHDRLSQTGRKQIEGRCRDSLQADSGFSPLYLELDIARQLLGAEFQVEFADMEGTAKYDLRFWKGEQEGEVECKSLSVDAGRKVHRRDFYRFVDSLGSVLEQHARKGSRNVVVVTLEDRLPAADGRLEAVRSGVRRLLQPENNGLEDRVNGDFFTAKREPSDRLEALLTSTDSLYGACTQLYGQNCHAAGPIGSPGTCLIVVRSRREDDTSKPLLEAMKKGVSQCSGKRPAFIAVQYDDIQPSDLATPALRRRTAILSNFLFQRDRKAEHVVAARFSAFAVHVVDGLVGRPAIAMTNPNTKYRVATADYPPFLAHVPDEDFARLLGVPIPGPIVI